MPLGPNLLHNPTMLLSEQQGEGWDSGSIGPDGLIQFNGDTLIASHTFLPLEEGKDYLVILHRDNDAPISVRLGGVSQTLPAGVGAISLTFTATSTTSDGSLIFNDHDETAVGYIDLVEVREVLTLS